VLRSASLLAVAALDEEPLEPESESEREDVGVEDNALAADFAPELLPKLYAVAPIAAAPPATAAPPRIAAVVPVIVIAPAAEAPAAATVPPTAPQIDAPIVPNIAVTIIEYLPYYFFYFSFYLKFLKAPCACHYQWY
jgi:hypothetical protein